MPFSVSVELNPVRTEVRKPGYAKGRGGRDLRCASLQPALDEWTMLWTTRYAPSEDPPEVWREPETGVLIPRPSGLSADLFDDSANAPRWVALNQCESPAGLLEETVHQPGGARMMWLKLPSDGSAPGSLTPPAWLSGFLPTGFVWALATVQPLATDESFTVVCQPYGVAADRPEWLMAVAFGGRHVLTFASNGMGRFHSADGGVLRAKREFGWGGGMDLAQPFRVAVIPLNPRFLALASSGSGAPGKQDGLREPVSAGVLLDLAELGCPIDEIDGAPVKAAADRLWVALPAAAIGVGIHRNRFASAQLAFAPEQLPEPRPLPSQPVRAIGYTFWGSGATTGATNDQGGAWNPASDVRLVPTVQLVPSSDGVHPPELWGLEVEIPPETRTPPHSAADVSAKWSSIHVRLSAHPAEDEARVRMERSSDWPNLLKHDVGLRVSQDGLILFDGYVVRQTRVPYGFTDARHRAGLEEETVAESMWRRLDQTPARDTLPLSWRTVGQAIRHLLGWAGFSLAQMQIDSRLDSILASDWDGSNVWLAPASDSTVGDVLRALCARFGVQNGGDLRIRWDGSKWIAGWRTGSSSPTAAFVLDSSLVPLLVADWDGRDASRWAAKVLKVHSQPEFGVAPMPFNRLEVEALGSDGRSGASHGAQISPRPAVLDDPTDAMYDGRLVVGLENAARSQFGGGLLGAAMAARRMWDSAFRASRTVSFDAEFRLSAVQPDDLVWIAARSPVDVPSRSIVAGDPVSLGAWVVEEIQAEIAGDDDGSGAAARRAFHSGNYTLSWWGAWSQTGFPMFTEVVPQP